MAETRGYLHQPGLHCGSTALRNLLAGRGLALSEPLLFGLGAGLGFSLHDGARGLTPPMPERFFVGRSLSYEEDLCAGLGLRLEVLRFDSSAAALREAQTRIAAGEPVLAFTDLFHLPYLGARGHWFGHLIALAGTADGRDTSDLPRTFLVGDNERAQLEPVPRSSLEAALSAASAAPSRECVLLALHDVHPLEEDALREAVRRALALQGRQLRTPRRLPHAVWRGTLSLEGIAALRDLPDELRSWQGAADLGRRLRFAAQVIEVRGNGGGLFRRLYARFLREAESLGVREAGPLAPLCLSAADAFTALARELERLRSDLLHANDRPPPLELEPAARLAHEVAAAEEALLMALEELPAR